MPVPLPPLNDLQGSGTTPTSDAFRTAMGQLRTFISEKLGTSGSNSDAQTALGAGAAGKTVFVAATSIALTQLLGSGSISDTDAKIYILLGRYHSAQAGTSVVTTDAAGLATITFPREFLSLLGNNPTPTQPSAPLFAIVSLGDINSMSAIAPLASSYTSTTMQIKSAASVTIRVNWLAVAQYRPFTV